MDFVSVARHTRGSLTGTTAALASGEVFDGCSFHSQNNQRWSSFRTDFGHRSGFLIGAYQVGNTSSDFQAVGFARHRVNGNTFGYRPGAMTYVGNGGRFMYYVGNANANGVGIDTDVTWTLVADIQTSLAAFSGGVAVNNGATVFPSDGGISQGVLNISGSAYFVNVAGLTTDSTMIGGGLTTDNHRRFRLRTDGGMAWGNGTVAATVYLTPSSSGDGVTFSGITQFVGRVLSDLGSGALPAAIDGSNLQMAATNATGISGIESFGYGTTGMTINCRMAGGTRASPAASPSGALFFNLVVNGHNGTSYITSPAARYQIAAGSTWSGTNRETRHHWWGTPAGSQTVGEWMRLSHPNAQPTLVVGATVPLSTTTGIECVGAVRTYRSGADTNTMIELQVGASGNPYIHTGGTSANVLSVTCAGSIEIVIDDNNNDTAKTFVVRRDARLSGTALLSVAESGLITAGTDPGSGPWLFRVGLGTRLAGPVRLDGEVEVGSVGLRPGSTWTAAALLSTKSWRAAAYGGGYFVVASDEAGSSARIAHSADGVRWREFTYTSQGRWRSIAYSATRGDGAIPGRFVMVGGTSGDGTAAIANTGGDWGGVTPAAENQWESVCYGKGKFVAVASTGTGNRAMYSDDDGATWSLGSGLPDNTWKAVCYGNGVFVAIGSSASDNRVATSSDGINWTSHTGFPDNTWEALTFFDGLFIAVASAGASNLVMSSADGVTWNSYNYPAGATLFRSIAWGSQVMIGVGNPSQNVLWQPGADGYIPRTPLNLALRTIVYGNGRFVALRDATVNSIYYTGSIADPDPLSREI